MKKNGKTEISNDPNMCKTAKSNHIIIIISI